MFKPTMIRIGDFFFRYRDGVFPLIIVGFFALAIPPKEVFNSERLGTLLDLVGVALVLLGLSFRGAVIGYAYIKRGGLNKKVYAEDLVTSGLFGICRNPLYVGNVLIYCGIFVMHGDPMVVVLGIGSFCFIYQCIVYAEERFLREKFGEGYEAYCRDVPRWIPQFSKFSAAVEGMKFNLPKVIIKDYSTIATSLIAVTFTELYEELVVYVNSSGADHNLNYVMFLVGVILFIAVCAAIVRIAKKRRWIVEARN